MASQDRDAVLALAKRSSWRCGLGRFPEEDLREVLDRDGGERARLLESDGAVSGLAHVAMASHSLLAIAAGKRGLLALIDWGCDQMPRPAVLRTSAAAAGEARALLAMRGFAPYVSQRTMQFGGGAVPAASLGAPLRFAGFNELWLKRLLALYVAAWPDNEVDAIEAERSFRDSDGLVLVHDGEHVAGYAMWERVDDGLGLIHEVAVHPTNRRRGIGTALAAFAVNRLRPLTSRIELVVMDHNPAQRLYERLGFQVVEDDVFMARRLD